MALLKKIEAQGISDLDRIVSMDGETAKSISASEIEINTVADTRPTDLIYNYAALSHSAVQKEQKEEIRQKTEAIFEEIESFLAEKKLKNSLIDASKGKDSKDESKRLADELLDRIAKKTAKWYDNNSPEIISALEETFGFRQDLFKEMLREKMGIDWRQITEQLSQMGNLSRENREVQRLAGFFAGRTSKYQLLKDSLAGEVGDDRELNPMLEKEVTNYLDTAGYGLIPQSYNNSQLFSLLEAVVSHKTYDLSEEFGTEVEKVDNKTSLDGFVNSIDVSAVSGLVIIDAATDMSKSDLVNAYAKLVHYEVQKEVERQSIEAKNYYNAQIKEFLGERKTITDEAEAEKLIDRLLQNYIKKRWTATGGEKNIDAALIVYNSQKEFANVLLNKDISKRGARKSQLIKLVTKSHNLLNDRNIERLVDDLASSSVTGNISRTKIEEEISERAIGRYEPKDSEIIEAGQRYANSMGYKIKDDAEVGVVLGIVGRAVTQASYDLSDSFNRIYKKPANSSIQL